MYTKEFYLSQFEDFKKTVMEHIIEISALDDEQEKFALKRMYLYTPLFRTWVGLSNKRESVYLFENFLKRYDVSWLHEINYSYERSYISHLDTPESFLKAYSMLHQFDFTYEGLGMYNYSNRKYHSLFTAIGVIFNSELFEKEVGAIFPYMDRSAVNNECQEIYQKILEKMPKNIKSEEGYY